MNPVSGEEGPGGGSADIGESPYVRKQYFRLFEIIFSYSVGPGAHTALIRPRSAPDMLSFASSGISATVAAMRPLLCLLLCAASPLYPQQADLPQRKPETLLMMPEPKAMRTAFSIIPAGAKQTVLTPYREASQATGGLEAYGQESLARLGFGTETFLERAKTAADKRLLQLRPDLVKGADGKIAYAVYRGESPLFATLLIAPSLPKIFEDLFGREIWVALPDRHALYVFPARPDLIEEFHEDLAERYAEDAFAASCEVFALKVGAEPTVVATFAPRE